MDAKRDTLEQWQQYIPNIITKPEDAFIWFQKRLKKFSRLLHAQQLLERTEEDYSVASVNDKILLLFITAGLADYFKKMKDQADNIYAEEHKNLFIKYFENLNKMYESLLLPDTIFENDKKVSLNRLIAKAYLSMGYFAFAEKYNDLALSLAKQNFENANQLRECFVQSCECYYRAAGTPAPELAEKKYGKAILMAKEALTHHTSHKVNYLWNSLAKSTYKLSVLYCDPYYKRFGEAALGFLQSIEAAATGLATDMNSPKLKLALLECMSNSFQCLGKLMIQGFINKQSIVPVIPRINNLIFSISTSAEPILVELKDAMMLFQPSPTSLPAAKSAESVHQTTLMIL